MPELPEVETVRRGIAPHVCDARIKSVLVRDRRLRWPIAADFEQRLAGQTVHSVERRAKYLLLVLDSGRIMIHLGMSGRLYLVAAEKPVEKHDHVDITLNNGHVLRYTDPRRFGSMHWLEGENHPLLDSLGPEPLGEEFSGDLLYARSRGRSAPVKAFLMDARIVVGVGNIYANEALFQAGIRPRCAAGKVSLPRYRLLAAAVKDTLSRAIAEGGTTLRDFVGGDGKPGYFAQELLVYGRGGKPCPGCGKALKEIRLAQRSTVFCTVCQR